jgi:transposase InsO family protein
MGRYLVEAHLREGRSVAELAAAHGVHRSWVYKLLARYRAEGEAGLAPRSRRPHSCPDATSTELEDEIVTLRKQLAEEGLDAGAVTIHWHLSRRQGPVPSTSTVHRVLRRRGFVVPEPRKRPRSSFVRFEASLPNELWQSDMTHWALADGTGVEIVNFVDDHSRLCLASVALPVTKAVDVAEIFQAARQRHGTPAAVLTDNGCIYTAKHRNGKVVLETELERLGVVHKHSRPYHPQTCGKVERFHQTLKKYLAKQPAAETLVELQAVIDRFVAYYNDRRPHRSIGRRPPREVFDAKAKAHPPPPAGHTHFRVRHDVVDKTGAITLRHHSKLHHIGMGARHRGRRVVMLVADLDVRVLDTEGELLRHLTLDPTRDYQRQDSG